MARLMHSLDAHFQCPLKTEAKARGLTLTWRCTGSHKCGVIDILPEKLAAVIEALQQAPTLATVSRMLMIAHDW